MRYLTYCRKYLVNNKLIFANNNTRKLCKLYSNEEPDFYQKRCYKNFGHRPKSTPKLTKWYIGFLTVGITFAAIDWKWVITWTSLNIGRQNDKPTSESSS
ncbi:hypothetical protein GWI33_015715 [Rhynchophorus ferrugineus]|uniref:Uncharacterized protein n=1 Tax=Rhynchophorus ferrugineus TaxID=354439 RepID=A0A834I2N2_RHYFE|nr:hypothetical protein GWI33_015715 [Rhynchophorus ferrugineus]